MSSSTFDVSWERYSHKGGDIGVRLLRLSQAMSQNPKPSFHLIEL